MAEQTTPTPDDPYTAVIYFHGMGNQRRYEESSRLIDAIDTYLGRSDRARNEPRGILRDIEPLSEPSRIGDDHPVTYIEANHIDNTEGGDYARRTVRFYECYWAPIMSPAPGWIEVGKWVLKQARRPLRTLASPWRERQRLRRAALAEIYEKQTDSLTDEDQHNYKRLLRAYAEFDQADNRDTYPEGTFDQFQKFLSADNSYGPDTRNQLQDMAAGWRRHYIRTEARNLLWLTTILLALILTVGLMVWGIVQGLGGINRLAGLPMFAGENVAWLQSWLAANAQANATTALSILVGLVGFLGLGKFLSVSMGDVQAWATYEETDTKYAKRQKVLDTGVDLFRHVLKDENCTRVAVVSHSLGTSVALDTILAVARLNRSENPDQPIKGPCPLEKVRHFVTIASPVDKINYFFESTRSDFHRYTRVIETLRGDIGTVPFSKTPTSSPNIQPHVHWVNFWDQADVISGPLHSSAGRLSLEHGVDNVHVANLQAPDPGASHSAYFQNRTVIARLFEMIFLNKYNLGELELLPDNQGYDYASARIGPGDPTGLHTRFFQLALALPWIGLIYVIALAFGWSTLGTASCWALIACVVILVAGFVIRKARRVTNTL